MISNDRRRGLPTWSTRELLVTAVIGIVFGALMIPLNYAYIPLIALGPVVQWACTGPWHFPSFFATYVLRRPGAGWLVGLLYSLILVPFTPFGVLYIVAGLSYGGSSELGMALATRYRHFSWARLLTGGLSANVLNFLISAMLFQALNFAPSVIVASLVVSSLSTMLCVVLARQLADALARTGVRAAAGRTGNEV